MEKTASDAQELSSKPHEHQKKDSSQEWPSLDAPSESSVSNASTKQPDMSKQPAKCKPPPGFVPTSSNPTPQSAPNRSSGPPPGFAAAVKDQQGEKKQSFIVDKVAGDASKMKQFKIMSNAFLRSEISAEDYYMKSLELFGDDWMNIFEDCMSGLPNPEKRSELRLVHIKSNAPAWPKISQPSHVMRYTNTEFQRSSKKKGKAPGRNKVKSRSKAANTASVPWNPSSTGSKSDHSSTLDSSDYPSLSAAANDPINSVPSSTWSNRVAMNLI